MASTMKSNCNTTAVTCVFGEPSTRVDSIGEWLLSSITPLVLAIAISISFMVGEIFVQHNVPPHTQFIINTMSDILLGPFTVISFLHADAASTIFFFMTLWHFLCDHSVVKASAILTLPQRGDTCADLLHWVCAVFTWVHHTGIGTLKLASDLGVIRITDEFGEPPVNVRTYIGVILLSAGFIHLSLATQRLQLAPRLSAIVMAFMITTRLAVDAFLATQLHGTGSPFAYWMACDFVYMVGVLLVNFAYSRARKYNQSRASATNPDDLHEQSEWSRRSSTPYRLRSRERVSECTDVRSSARQSSPRNDAAGATRSGPQGSLQQRGFRKQVTSRDLRLRETGRSMTLRIMQLPPMSDLHHAEEGNGDGDACGCASAAAAQVVEAAALGKDSAV